MTRQQRPGGESGPQVNLAADHILDELDTLAALVDGAFVVLVRLNAPNAPAVLAEQTPDKYRRRVFLSAAAAERAARAAVARGESVRVYLAELSPLYRLTGAEGVPNGS